jgi:recombination protein RecR
MYTESLENLVHYFSKLPSIGKKTAQRLAFHVLKNPDEFAKGFAQSLINVKEMTRFCDTCFNISETTQCNICSNPKRDNHVLMVVAEFSDIYAIEKTNEYRGKYHVLGGLLSPLDGIGPDQLHLHALLKRTKEETISEIILALTPNTEGEATCTYLLRQFENSEIKLSRIARGVPTGSQLDYIDQITLGRAITGRNSAY